MALGLVFSPDDRLLAGFDREKVRVWETATGQQLDEFRGHQGPLQALAFAGNGSSLASGSTDAALVWDLTGGAALPGVPARDLAAAELDQLGNDLAGEDASRARRSLWTLTTVPQKAVPLLQQRLQWPPFDPRYIRKLIADLDDDAFAVRQKASRDLGSLGSKAEPYLRETLRGQPSLEVQRRVEDLLESLEQRPLQIPIDELGRLRAVQALEQIGTLEARRVLREVAQRDSSARLTQDARVALQRLEYRSPNR
jgi:hypothetical protein